ncbi:hypothetical protein GCM10015535_35210 [Streptomyces gelaticus]|uniref:Uncharacterized protein n=1 Tax=Streptomyces gelaticus TaxID=285446 RepID=A0ABQ2VZI8_9ACTN|nr:hypothetical protein [Streptomyces gelaticus]GGV86657.1 hypothetical protein GCM10015535_35210 [Streptomyces gelaticus]
MAAPPPRTAGLPGPGRRTRWRGRRRLHRQQQRPTRAQPGTSAPVRRPTQLTIVANHLLVALINHGYQHDQWISEVRAGNLGHALPPDPEPDWLCRIDGYLVIDGL